MIDAMAIRKQVQYNSHTQTMSGFVDLGDGMNETSVARSLEGLHRLLPYKFIETRNSEVFAGACIRGIAGAGYQSPVCDNRWTCNQYQHVHNARMPAAPEVFGCSDYIFSSPFDR